MKKYSLFLLFFLSSVVVFAQNKEKVKGSRNVSTFIKEIAVFKEIELEDYFEVFLVKGEKPQIKVEADDNLYENIKMDVVENMLSITMTKEPVKFKKLILYITHTNDLAVIRTRGKVVLNAIDEILLNKLTLKSYDDSKLFINATTVDFALEANDDSEIELNLKSEKVKLSLTKSSELKALIKSKSLICDMYQKTNAAIEGKVDEAVIRLDNNSELKANKLTVKNLELVAESYSSCSVNPEDSVVISANGKAEINLLGEATIQIKKFREEAKLFKKVK